MTSSVLDSALSFSLLLSASVIVTVDGKDYVQTSFEATEIMSTYLLAFVVCKFEYLQSHTDDGVLVITVYNLMCTYT